MPCRSQPADGVAKRLVAVVLTSVAVTAAGLPSGPGFGETVVIGNGSVGSNTTPASYDALEVYGTDVGGDRSTYNADALLTLAEDLRVHDAGVFNAGADVTCGSGVSAYGGGTINLDAGTLSTPSLSLSGVGSAGQSGGRYNVTTLSLADGATLTFGLGDCVDSLSISDAGSRLDGLAPLTLTSLSLSAGSVLYLGDFTGTGPIADWGLRMAGDDTFFLEGLIRGGRLTAGIFPFSVIFDADSSMTYVMRAVPEIDPNTAHGAVMLLISAAGLLERRLRRVALAR